MSGGGETVRISEVFSLIAELGLALGAAPTSKHPGCWECQVSPRWRIAVNGHREPKRSSTGCDVPPFHAYAERDGWPAGLFAPNGGIIAGYDSELEDELIADLKLAINGPPDSGPGPWMPTPEQVAASVPQECSICRRTHGLEVIHACE